MRHFISTLLLCWGLSLWTVVCAQAQTVKTVAARQVQNKLPIVEMGKTKYVIALADDAIPAERTAASELQTYIAQVTGATLPIQNEAEVSVSTPQIIVGAGARAQKSISPRAWSSLGVDGIVIKTQGKNLVLAGSRPRGTLYAVYQFLEDAVGVRWWTPAESTVPKYSNLSIASQNIVYTPPFGYREHYTTAVQADPLFATRMRENGHHQKQGEALGGHYSLLGWVHSFQTLLPIETYFKDHPEWYSDPKNGNKPCTAASPEPAFNTWQLNLTDPEMRRELTKKAIELIRANPDAGIISVSANDNGNYCQSPGDLVAIERLGSITDVMLDFVNAVSADIEKEFPNFFVETLAYGYTRTPPLIVKPRHNVVIRFCTAGDAARPIDSDSNTETRDSLNAWKNISPHLYIWDYIANFGLTIWPHPNLRALAPNMRYFARSNVFAMFSQGDAYTNGTGDFVQLRTWLVARLMWNPELDDNKLIDEFLKGYYGAAAPYLRSYLDLIQDSFLKTGEPLSLFQSDNEYLTLDVMQRAWDHFQAAQAAVKDDPVLTARVRRERLALDNVIISKYEFYAHEKEKSARPASVVPEDIRAFIADFIATANANRAAKISEGITFSSYATLIGGRYSARLPLPEPLLSEIPAAEVENRVIDGQDSQFRYHKQGILAQQVDDALASDGKAGRTVGNVTDWLLQYDINRSSEVLQAGLWRVYVVIRIEPKPDATLNGLAFVAGLYSTTHTPGVGLHFNEDLAALADGKYHVVEIGKTKLDSGCYVWISPPRREDIEALYVDRIILVRDK